MKNVYNYLLKGVGFKENDNVVVAVSGGPDSMALLHLLIKLREKISINIICAHVNHNVRKESFDEALNVEEYCHQNKVIFEYMIIDSYGDDNFHNEARVKRYNYFEELIKKYNSNYLLTAHHADDLMETILMRLVRGSTLRGYAGFAKLSDMNGYKIIRPLIEMTKEELEDYDNINGIPYAIDNSNKKDVYTRNRYRKYVVPMLKKEDKNVHKKFYKFSRTILAYNNYIDKEVDKVFDTLYKDNTLYLKDFNGLDDLIKTRVIDKILEIIYQDDLMLITDRHEQLISDLIVSKKGNGYIYLPNNIKVVKKYDKISFTPELEVADGYEIEIIDHVSLPNGHCIDIVDECDSNGNDICRLNSNDIKLPLRVRTRHNGDRMYVKNMNGSKKINDIFIDSKIDKIKRDMWPVVVDSNDNVVWLPNLKKSQFNKTNSEKYDIILRYY